MAPYTEVIFNLLIDSHPQPPCRYDLLVGLDRIATFSAVKIFPNLVCNQSPMFIKRCKVYRNFLPFEVNSNSGL